MRDQSIRGMIFTWAGIIGGSITTFANLQSLVEVADWASRLSNSWSQLVNIFWDQILFWVKIEIDTFTRFQMTMALTMLLVGIGAYYSNLGNRVDKEIWPVQLGNVLRLNVLIAIMIYLLTIYIAYNADKLPSSFYQIPNFEVVFDIAFHLLYGVAIFVGLSHWPLDAAIKATAAAIIFNKFFQLSAAGIVHSNEQYSVFATTLGAAITIVFALFVLLIAPPRAFAVRLIFILIGITALFALNEFSKLNINLSAT